MSSSQKLKNANWIETIIYNQLTVNRYSLNMYIIYVFSGRGTLKHSFSTSNRNKINMANVRPEYRAYNPSKVHIHMLITYSRHSQLMIHDVVWASANFWQRQISTQILYNRSRRFRFTKPVLVSFFYVTSVENLLPRGCFHLLLCLFFLPLEGEDALGEQSKSLWELTQGIRTISTPPSPHPMTEHQCLNGQLPSTSIVTWEVWDQVTCSFLPSSQRFAYPSQGMERIRFERKASISSLWGANLLL